MPNTIKQDDIIIFEYNIDKKNSRFGNQPFMQNQL